MPDGSGTKKELIDAERDFRCDARGDMIRAKHARPLRVPGRYQFDLHAMFDAFFAHDAEGESRASRVIARRGARSQEARYFHGGTRAPLARAAPETIPMARASRAGEPQSIFVDRGKEFPRERLAHVFENGVEADNAALEARRQLGRVERLGSAWKEVWHRAGRGAQFTKEKDLRSFCGIRNQVRNDTEIYDGHSRADWAPGTRDPRIPGSIFQDIEADELQVQESTLGPESAMV